MPEPVVPDRDLSAEQSRLAAVLGPSMPIRRFLGSGGFANVYVAFDTRLKREVAIKTLRAELALSSVVRERFRQEAEVVARLRHPHIVPIYSVHEADDLVFFVMPLIEGQSLATLVESGERFDIEEACRILCEAADALGAAHAAGVVHRDVKPDNIMLEGAARRVVVMDFGIAKVFDVTDGAMTGTGMLIGTPYYMSPEQASGERTIDHRSDQYSLALVGYELFAGRKPFTGNSPQGVLYARMLETPERIERLRTDIPLSVANALHRALSPDPADRFASMTEFAGALRATFAKPGSVLPRTGTRRPAAASGHPARKWRAAIAVISLVVLVALLAWRGAWSRTKGGAAASPASPSASTVSQFAVAREMYFAKQYKDALPQFATISRDAQVPASYRREALRYEAGAQLAIGDTAGAKTALQALMQYEPPMAFLGEKTPELKRLYYELRRQKAAMQRIGVRHRSQPAVAVYSFETYLADTSYAPLGRGMVGLLESELVGRAGIRVVDASAGCIAVFRGDSMFYSTDARRCEHALQPSLVILGSVADQDGQMLVTAWVFDVATAMPASFRQFALDRNDVLNGIRSLSQAVAADIYAASTPANTTVATRQGDARVAPAPSAASRAADTVAEARTAPSPPPAPRSAPRSAPRPAAALPPPVTPRKLDLRAAMLYSRALEALDKHDTTQAIANLEQFRRLAPDFAPGQELFARLQRLKPSPNP